MTGDREKLLATLRTQTADWPHLTALWENARTGTITRRVYRFGKLYFETGERALAIDGPAADAVSVYSNRVMVPVTLDADRIDLDPQETP